MSELNKYGVPMGVPLTLEQVQRMYRGQTAEGIRDPEPAEPGADPLPRSEDAAADTGGGTPPRKKRQPRA